MRCFREGKVNKTWEINNIDSIHNTTLHREPLECTKVHEVWSSTRRTSRTRFSLSLQGGGEKRSASFLVAHCSFLKRDFFKKQKKSCQHLRPSDASENKDTSERGEQRPVAFKSPPGSPVCKNKINHRTQSSQTVLIHVVTYRYTFSRCIVL